MVKIEPAVVKLCYSLANGVNYIDIAKDLSVLNRRLYRQGKNYGIQNIQMYLDGADSAAHDTSQHVRSIEVATIPNTWVTHNAWSKGFRVWNAQQKDALRALAGGTSGLSARPRWADFKIAMDAAHVQLDSSSGDQDISIDVRAGDFSTIATPDEWKISNFVWEDDNGVDHQPLIHMLGQVASTQLSYVGLIENYGDSRIQPNASEPTLPADASASIYARLYATEDVSDAIIDSLEGENDQPPYDADAYPGGASVSTVAHPQAWAAVNVQNPVGNTGPVLAPCGLLRVTVDAWHDADPNTTGTDLTDVSVSNTKIIVTVASGPYRGVLATPMGQ